MHCKFRLFYDCNGMTADQKETNSARWQRPLAVLGSAIFLVIAPGTIAILIPRWISHWRFGIIMPSSIVFWVLGSLLILAGLPVLLDSFARFALQGLGTPAPIVPPQHLVVTGLYRYVRNPMYVAVLSLILGQALLFGNIRLLLYALLIWSCFHAFVLLYEEPVLRRKFGTQYEEFCANVPRWIPRFRPWKQPKK